jgi:hypothetical protein
MRLSAPTHKAKAANAEAFQQLHDSIIESEM